jgi:Domain of unknown function (DUF4178)
VASLPPPPRAYRAACPNCGAPVEFRSAASAFAVCSYCHATLARDGAALRRIGIAAELFADFSPLQLGASGRFANAPFTVVGRVQYAYDGGVWNEWQVFFDAGRHAWLSEDNGRYVIAFATNWSGAPPQPATLRVGAPVSVGSQAWTVASMVRARIGALEGELVAAPAAGDLLVVELRNPADEVASLEYRTGAPPLTFVGRSVDLAGLQMQGLRQEAAARPVAAQSAPCPQCGAALTPTLSSTKAIVCGQCHAVVDLSHGLGGDLAYYSQHNADHSGFHSQLELGTTATLALGGPADTWQAVGYVERATVAAPGDEVEFWREYLLYHRTRGFAFLVDANDGWSWSAPITGAPVQGRGAVQWHGTNYRELYRYDGRVTYVLGEFYWNLAEGERTANIDYADASGRRRLNRETTNEIVWSAGETLAASTVATAFGLPDAAPLARDATALQLRGSNLRTLLIGAILVVLVLAILAQCSSDRCRDVRAAYGAQSNEYRACARSSGSGAAFRSAGGAFGGFSGSGGHK